MNIRISLVSYLNARPFQYGLHFLEMDEITDISVDNPSECARKLIFQEAEIGLVPIAAIPKIPNAKVISDYCIGTNNEVYSVCLYAEKSIGELHSIYLDYESRTSVALLKFLLKEHWKVTPELIPASQGFESKIHGNVGGLVIGDRAIEIHDNFPYCYDLGKAWRQATGLPFVFAAWVTNTTLSDSFLEEFNEALKFGVDNAPKLADLLDVNIPGFSLRTYYTKHINFHLDDEKRKAMELFLQLIEKERS